MCSNPHFARAGIGIGPKTIIRWEGAGLCVPLLPDFTVQKPKFHRALPASCLSLRCRESLLVPQPRVPLPWWHHRAQRFPRCHRSSLSSIKFGFFFFSYSSFFPFFSSPFPPIGDSRDAALSSSSLLRSAGRIVLRKKACARCGEAGGAHGGVFFFIFYFFCQMTAQPSGVPVPAPFPAPIPVAGPAQRALLRRPQAPHSPEQPPRSAVAPRPRRPGLGAAGEPGTVRGRRQLLGPH